MNGQEKAIWNEISRIAGEINDLDARLDTSGKQWMAVRNALASAQDELDRARRYVEYPEFCVTNGAGEVAA